MTTTVVEHAASGQTPVRPILLKLNCSKTVGHLGENNSEIFDLYRVRMICLAFDVPPQYVSTALAEGDLLNLCRAEDESPRAIEQKLKNDEWLTQRLKTVIQELYSKKGRRRDPSLTDVEQDSANVNLIILADWMTKEGCLLRPALSVLFPNASYRSIDVTNPLHAKPQRIWDEPEVLLCRKCETKMRPAGEGIAGTIWVCEKCGSTRNNEYPIDPTDSDIG